MPGFEEELRKLINTHNIENQSDTPDNVLAKYILGCLDSFNKAVKERDTFFNTKVWESRQKENIEQFLKEGGFYK